jgi:glycosyltransferase involved in cell wall biosynthesis
MQDWDVGVAPFLPVGPFYFSPLKVVEYMASGLCAVASALGQLPELLGDDRGILVQPGSADRIAEAFVALAEDRERVAALGQRAREHALSTLTWQRNAERVLAALRARPREIAA